MFSLTDGVCIKSLTLSACLGKPRTNDIGPFDTIRDQMARTKIRNGPSRQAFPLERLGFISKSHASLGVHHEHFLHHRRRRRHSHHCRISRRAHLSLGAPRSQLSMENCMVELGPNAFLNRVPHFQYGHDETRFQISFGQLAIHCAGTSVSEHGARLRAEPSLYAWAWPEDAG